MPIKQAKGSKHKCDLMVRKILLKQHNVCERCGSRDNLQVSHIISRRYSATRTDLANVQLLCARDHFYFTHWPKEFSKWITDSIGTHTYDRLREKAETVTKVDWDSELARLQAVYDQLVLIDS
jgi:HNH endonuclease